MPFDPSNLSQSMRRRNPHLLNPSFAIPFAEKSFREVEMSGAKPAPVSRHAARPDPYPALIPFLMDHGLSRPQREVRFHKVRRWQFDYGWLNGFVALEVEGGAWKKDGGRHNRGSGFIRDMLKYSTAASLGWLVIRRTPQDLLTLETVELLKGAMRR